MAQNFSSREGITSSPAEITIRYDAPEGLRIFLFDTLLNRLKIGSQRALYIISGILLEPTEGNWTPDFVKDEIRRLLTDDHRCPWNKIYDIIEAFHSELNGYAENQRLFTEQINGYFQNMELDGSWKMGRLCVEEMTTLSKVTKKLLSYHTRKISPQQQNILKRRATISLDDLNPIQMEQ